MKSKKIHFLWLAAALAPYSLSRADTFVTASGATVIGTMVSTSQTTTTIVQTWTATNVIIGTNTSTDQQTWTLHRGRSTKGIQPGTPGSAITNPSPAPAAK